MTPDIDDKNNDMPLRPLNLAGFEDRAAISAHIRSLCSYLSSEDTAISDTRGHRDELLRRLEALQPENYGKTRNYITGDVTNLSPFIRHGLINLTDVRDKVMSMVKVRDGEKLIQQMAWREYWQRLYRQRPEIIWNDAESYKTGYTADDYADELPEDIVRGQTGVACIDGFITQLLEQGTMHNHARLYVAAYICHWRRIKWQAGARFFLSHLLDGDPASNNLSWQWGASTFAQKPYYYNLENVRKFSPDTVDTSEANNAPLAGSYEELYARLFPNLEPA